MSKSLPLLLVVLLALAAGWQLLKVNELGQRWQVLPQRALAGPLADYAEPQAVRTLLTDDAESQQQLVDELVGAGLVVSVRLYDGGGQLLAEAGDIAGDGPLPYIRPLYQEDRPVGFLHLALIPSLFTEQHNSLWQQLLRHLGWLLPLSLLLGILLGLGLGRWRGRFKRQEAEDPPPEGSSG
ncbi:hypothetical protein [Zobellella iuensis]|uniref:SURF1-like protein n=1 Tax=Zobellella iuensis TaxID=2803811 RepID=A0ABS1QP70_9GAMM|nr:hypothetical protein [Zobellella iuensis]MBL1375948.1 hypothetical protein [Zobellella iuensis]